MKSTASGNRFTKDLLNDNRALERCAESLPPEAQEFLADEVSELDIISCLADELSIVALYRIVEINTGHMLAHEFREARGKSGIRRTPVGVVS